MTDIRILPTPNGNCRWLRQVATGRLGCFFSQWLPGLSRRGTRMSFASSFLGAIKCTPLSSRKVLNRRNGSRCFSPNGENHSPKGEWLAEGIDSRWRCVERKYRGIPRTLGHFPETLGIFKSLRSKKSLHGHFFVRSRRFFPIAIVFVWFWLAATHFRFFSNCFGNFPRILTSCGPPWTQIARASGLSADASV